VATLLAEQQRPPGPQKSGHFPVFNPHGFQQFVELGFFIIFEFSVIS